MNVIIKSLLFSVILLVSNACNNTDTTLSSAEKLANKVTIFRDVYGTPHIKAETDESLLFGLAYAQAEDHFHRMEQQLITSIGRLTEVESGNPNDVRVKAFEIERLSKEEYQGVQYAYIFKCYLFSLNRKITQSRSRKGNCWDNAVAESFFKTIKHEWLNRFKFTSFNQLYYSVEDYINWYNTKRLHSSLGYISPLEMEIKLRGNLNKAA